MAAMTGCMAVTATTISRVDRDATISMAAAAGTRSSAAPAATIWMAGRAPTSCQRRRGRCLRVQLRTGFRQRGERTTRSATIAPTTISTCRGRRQPRKRRPGVPFHRDDGFSHHAGELPPDGKALYGDVNGDGGADLQIAFGQSVHGDRSELHPLNRGPDRPLVGAAPSDLSCRPIAALAHVMLRWRSSMLLS